MLKRLLFFSLLLSYSLLGTAQLQLNEVSANRGVLDEISKGSDWIEIYNAGDDAVNLGDYFLSDNSDNWQKFDLPDAEIAPNEYFLLYASGKDRPFRAEHWESAVVAEMTWSYFANGSDPGIEWFAQDFDDSAWNSGTGGFGYGDDDDGTEINGQLTIYMRREFQAEDISQLSHMLLHADYDDGYIAYLNGVEISRSWTMTGVTPTFDTPSTEISEAVLYAGGTPESVIWDEKGIEKYLLPGNNVLAVEVHNSGIFSSDMSGNFFLSFGLKNETSLFGETPPWFAAPYTTFHTNFKLSSGEALILSDSEGNLTDILTLDAGLRNGLSMGRANDGSELTCIFDSPSPLEPNSGSWCYEGIETPPTALTPSGWHDAGTGVNLVAGPGQQVRFTQNGDQPSAASNIWTGAITLDQSSVLSLRSYGTGNTLPSAVVDYTYIIGQDNYNLPVFSLITDSLNLWDWNEGIYVSGPNASPDYPYFGSNFWEPWSKRSRLHYFDGEKIQRADEEFDLEIHGGWSRAEAQKSFRVDFKADYSGDLNWPLFPQKPEIDKFNNINLRNGGQHWATDKIQDAFISRLIDRTHADNMAYEPCIVYLNGAYWGIYGTREKVDEQYVEDNYGIDKDCVDLMNSWGPLHGSSTHFEQSTNLLASLSPFPDGYYDEFASRFDVKNYMDYFITETYFQNVDWMGIAWGANNIKLWRERSMDGKWRYVVYDLDGGLGTFGSLPQDNYIAAARNPGFPTQHSQLFDRILQNEKFQCEFVNRYADLMNTTFQPDSTGALIASMEATLEPAMGDHINRWEAPPSPFWWQVGLNTMQNFCDDRLDFARDHVEQEFGLTGQFEIVLDVTPPGAGRITISTIEPGLLPWSGVYFGGCPVTISVEANEGFGFVEWFANDYLNEDDGSIYDQSVTVDLFSYDTFLAVFGECPVGISVAISSGENELTAEVFGSIDIESYQWYLDGVEVAEGPTLSDPVPGVYTVTATQGFCSYTSDLFYYLVTDIIQIEPKASRCYPNPAQDHLVVELPGHSDALIRLCDVRGVVVLEKQITEMEILDVSGFAAGRYVLSILSDEDYEVLQLVIR